MEGNQETVNEAPRKRAPKTNLLNIVTGRLPVALVYLIRFHETGSNSEVAKRYGTSVGKVFDIKKNRNFSYVTADSVFSAEEVQAAKDWMERGATGREGVASEAIISQESKAIILKKIEEHLTVGSPDQLAARDGAWTQSRARKPKEEAASDDDYADDDEDADESDLLE